MFETEVERRVRDTLQKYHDVQPDGSSVRAHETGTTILRFRPCSKLADDGVELVSIAEVVTSLATGYLPPVNDLGIASLNARAVHGCFLRGSDGELKVRAQFALYRDEPASDLMTSLVLGAFGGQLAMAWSTWKTWAAPEALDEEAGFQEMPRVWAEPIPAEAHQEVAELMSQRGIVATRREDGVTAEVLLAQGGSPSRMLDPGANTALLTVQTAAVHPLAGVGYLATIAFPMQLPPEKTSAVCAYLNEREFKRDDFVPCIGAWGARERGRRVAYSAFIPAPGPYGMLHQTLLWWMVIRVHALRSEGFFEGMNQASSAGT